MAFWKKNSEDPWDIQPGQRTARCWPEEESEAGAAVETNEPVPEPEQSQACPWCGGPMERGYLYNSNGDVWWREGIATRFSNLAAGERLVTNRGFFGAYRYKNAWHCKDCHKVTFDFW